MSRHVADIDTDEDGWYWVACECGWCNGPFPGPVEAADDFEDHRFATVLDAEVDTSEKDQVTP